MELGFGVKKKVFIMGLVIILLLTLINAKALFVYAANSKTETITISSNITAKLHSAQIMTQGKAKIAAVTIEITNNSSNSLSLIDYWAKIKTKNGKTFQTKLKETDKAKERVLAKSTANITYYANVDSTTKYSDLAVDLIKWDFSLSNYERKIGTLNTKNNATGEVATYTAGDVLYNDIPLRVTLKQSMLFIADSWANVTLNVQFENQGFVKADLSEMKMYLQSEDNQLYTLDTTSLNTKSLNSKSINIEALQVSIPKAGINKKYSLIVAESEETAKVVIPSGMFALPKLFASVAVQPGKTKQIYLDGKPVSLSVSESSVSLIENEDTLITTLTFENISTSRISSNSLVFFVKTKDGIMYPLTSSEEGEIVLLPKIKKNIEVAGQIPNQSVLKTSEIIVMATSENATDTFLANFAITLGTSQEVSGSETIYNGLQIKQTTLNRIPFDLTDLIVAEFSVTNTTTTAKSKLNIQGYFKIDGVKLDSDTAKIVVLDELSTVGPGQTYNLLAYIEVPYNQVANKIEFVMLENTGQQSVKPIYQFWQKTLSKPVNVTSNKGYEIKSLGKQAQVKFIESNVYKNTTSDFFYAELEYTNKERRAISPAQLAGYIENQEGAVINVQLSEYIERIQPNGKIIISAWAQIPRGFEEEKLKFYFGEAFNLSEESVNESVSKAVVRPVLADVLVKEIDVQESFNSISISNYLINIRNLYVNVNLPDGLTATGINLAFDYDLIKNDSVYPNAEDQKLMIEFIDHGKSRLTYTKELSFDNKEMKDDTLLIGKNLEKTITFEEIGLYLKTDMSNVTINVYKVFKDNKMLLATKDVKWFTRTP